jgi:hypothetical protein
METSNPSSDNKKSKVQKISETSYNLMKDSQTYQMKITCNDNYFNINVKKLLGTSSYEAVYRSEDLQGTAFFLPFADLKDIHHELILKLNDQSVEFTEEVDQFTLKFDYTVGSKKSEAVMKIKKKTEENIEGIVDEMGRSIIGNLKMENPEIEYSQILVREEIDQMKKWIDPTNYNKLYFKLLYRATEHGKAAKDFHSKCDNNVT